jgi:hypothetical protein
LWQPDTADDEADTADEALIAELATLSGLDYAKRRKSAAKQLGITVSELDKFVVEARATSAASELAPLYPHWAVEPWEEPVMALRCCERSSSVSGAM